MKKTIWQSVAIVVTGLFIFSACSPEQSEFTVDSITTKATIKGQVYYETGDIAAPTANIPEGTKIFIDALLADYNSKATPPLTTEIKTFETTADATGNFSITIPCPITGLSGVDVRVQDFPGEKLVDGINEKGIFSAGRIATISDLKPTDILTVSHTSANAIRMFEFNKLPELVTIEITGQLVRPKVYYNNSNYRMGRDSSTNVDNVKITVTSGDNYSDQTYKVKVGADGIYKCKILANNKGVTIVKAEGLGIAGVFDHRSDVSTNHKAFTFQGYFTGGNVSTYTLDATNTDITLLEKKMTNEVKMEFHAYNQQEVFPKDDNDTRLTWNSFEWTDPNHIIKISNIIR